ncbi:MAG TPA: fibrillarin-like rRNA/tRNA 2'-O-methyltransferase [Acidobacteriota bacterium]|nr:fibrillarin-like rRNA/tRNA 2'-O-methyltransferase [Acidobacteriota bacterium]
MDKKRDRVDFSKFDKKPFRKDRDEGERRPREDRPSYDRPSGDRPSYGDRRSDRSERSERPSYDRSGRAPSFASSHFSSRVKPRMDDSELNRVSVKKFNSGRDARSEGRSERSEGRSEGHGKRFDRNDRPKFGGDRFEGSRDGPRDRSYARPPFVKSENKFADTPKFSKPFRSESEEKPRYERRDAEKARFSRPSSDSRPEYREKRSFDAPREADGESRLKGVFFFKNGLWTVNAVPGTVVYGERLFTMNGVEYRAWDPLRSKLAAGIKRGISQIGIKPGSTVLYLGCSTGTTVSHVAEIVGETGKVYALDVAPRVMRDLVLLSKKRTNILPIMADANRPTTFAQMVSQVDVVFMDIAQQNQIEIFEKNVQAFLKPGGFGLLSYKSRSVDISKTPKQLYEEARAQLSQTMTIVDYKTLDPFEKDHAMYVCKK